MIVKRYKDDVNCDLSSLSGRVPFTYFVGKSNKFAVLLTGDFYFPEKWNDFECSWLKQNGEILIDCPYPEALVKITFNVIPAKREKHTALSLKFWQGNVKLYEGKISKSEKCNLFISLIQGINPIKCEVDGEILSPYETCGVADARKLSFAFEYPFVVEQLS